MSKHTARKLHEWKSTIKSETTNYPPDVKVQVTEGSTKMVLFIPKADYTDIDIEMTPNVARAITEVLIAAILVAEAQKEK